MLAKGDRFTAKLIECVERDHWIVSYQGHLFQVKNTTTTTFRPGMELNLQVVSILPVKLKILAHNPSPGSWSRRI